MRLPPHTYSLELLLFKRASLNTLLNVTFFRSYSWGKINKATFNWTENRVNIWRVKRFSYHIFWRRIFDLVQYFTKNLLSFTLCNNQCKNQWNRNSKSRICCILHSVLLETSRFIECCLFTRHRPAHSFPNSNGISPMWNCPLFWNRETLSQLQFLHSLAPVVHMRVPGVFSLWNTHRITNFFTSVCRYVQKKSYSAAPDQCDEPAQQIFLEIKVSWSGCLKHEQPQWLEMRIWMMSWISRWNKRN